MSRSPSSSSSSSDDPVVTEEPMKPSKKSLKVDLSPTAPTSRKGTIPKQFKNLHDATEVTVKQQMEALEALTGFETSNRYLVQNEKGHRLFFIIEDTGCLYRNCCGRSRPFTMNVQDIVTQEDVFRIERKFRFFQRCYCCFCLQKITMLLPNDECIGRVHQECGCFGPVFSVYNDKDELELKIHGKVFRSECCGKIKYKIRDVVGNEVGMLTKEWKGLLAETLTDADTFKLVFPKDIDYNLKASLIGATMLIDFMHFENNKCMAAC